MPWKHVNDPTLGMVTAKPSTGLDPRATPYTKGCYLKKGEVSSDFGMTDFPVPGDTKTNELLGTVMRLEQFKLFSGLSYLLCFTTRYLYQYNTSTSTWDVAIQGILLDNCESAFTASANVTTTADTSIKIRGSKSNKNVIAGAFTTGIVAYRDNGGAIDISGANNTHLSFWIYTTANVASDVLRLRISEQNAGGTGATYADYTIPAVTSGGWKHVSVAIASPVASNSGTYPTDLDAVLSVALVANSDPGALTVYLDDIRTAKEFTGDEDNRFSVTSAFDSMIFTNGVDLPSKLVDSSGLVHTELTLTLPTGAITTSEVVLAFKDHILYMNNTENGADVPQRVSWSDIGTITTHVGGTSGFQDLTDDDSWIIGAAILSENEIAIYKERSIVQCIWVGGHTPFRFTTIVIGDGIISKDAISAVSGYHTVVTQNNVSVYNGTNNLVPIDEPIQGKIFERLDASYVNRAFVITVKADTEIQVWVPTAQTTPDEGYTFNYTDKSWYIKDRNISGFGFYQAQSSLTIGDLTMTIGEMNWTIGSMLSKAAFPLTLVGDVNGKVYKLDIGSLNNDGTAITNDFQTPDFVLPGTDEFFNKHMRVNQLIYEAAGQSVSTFWSNDSGLTWNPTQGSGQNTKSLTSVYSVYQQDFETTTEKVRFRFYNNTASSGFKLRYYGFSFIVRSDRR